MLSQWLYEELCDALDELVVTPYDPEQRDDIGAALSGPRRGAMRVSAR